MKVLFVCRNNTARSQVAASFFNAFAPNGHADSGGTQVEEPEKIVKDRPAASTIIQVMNEAGINIADNKRTQLQETDVEGYDKIIVMAEPETIPEWLSDKPNLVYWNISDPKGKSIGEVREIRDEIRDQVKSIL